MDEIYMSDDEDNIAQKFNGTYYNFDKTFETIQKCNNKIKIPSLKGKRDTYSTNRLDDEEIVSYSSIIGVENAYVLLVLDFNLTLVNNEDIPYPSSKWFLSNIRNLHSNMYIVIYTHASKQYIENKMQYLFPFFKYNLLISDTTRQTKPITHVRKLIKGNLLYLCGPSVIIDDKMTNLKTSEYDIVKDVNRYKTEFDVNFKLLFFDLKTSIEQFFLKFSL
jgi:hypothetical protein